ncbi:MAG: 3-dehydroquinate synthase [Treponema sp.]|nr:3-dehydroquinate synthase [Treponema sp.]
MVSDNFKIKYPAIHNGTDKSEIFFCSGSPDLVSVFKPGEDNSQRRFFVTDATVASLDCMKDFIAKFDDDVCGNDIISILGSGEPYKTIESVLSIIQKAIDAGFTRKDLFVGIGGGVICDMCAFAASIFKRGAAVQFVPTTLLAMVDASIGGKTGCDFNSYKNMIGTFFPAQKLYYWPDFIKFLPDNQYRSGLAEALKTGILYSRELYDLFKDESEKIKNRDKDILEKIIRECVKAKANVVEEDFTEKNIRCFLNLGHTFGHALETIAGLGAITHGDAVAWGIGRSVCLSYKKELCHESYKNEILEILENYGWETNPVPAIVKGGGICERFLSVMHKDKKNLDNTIRIIITKGIGDTIIEEVSESEIISVLK